MAHNQSSTLYIIDQAAFEALYIHHNQYDISGSCPSLKNMAPAFTSLNYDETAQWLTNYAHIYNLKHGDILQTPSRHAKTDVWFWHASKGPILSPDRTPECNVDQG